jgi:hypothetical protein
MLEPITSHNVACQTVSPSERTEAEPVRPPMLMPERSQSGDVSHAD